MIARVGSVLLLSLLFLGAFAGIAAAEVGLTGEWRFDELEMEYTNDSVMAGWWHLNEGSGTSVADSSGRGNAGTIQGVSGAGYSWNSGSKLGSGLTFNGINASATISHSSSLATSGQISVEAWVKINYPTNYSYPEIIRKEGQFLIVVDNNSNPNIAFQVYHSGAGWAGGWAGPVTVNAWHHVVGRVNSTNHVSLWVDGVQIGSWLSPNPIVNSTSALIIGNYGSGGNPLNRPFNGSVDEVAVYNRSLTDDEIRQHSGRVSIDRSGNGNHWAMAPVPWNSSGKFGAAADFKNNATITRASSSAFDTTKNITVEAWVRQRNKSFGGSFYECAISRPSVFFLGGRYDTGTNATFGLFFDDASSYYLQSTTIDAASWYEQWHHLAGTYDGTTMKIYIDGVLNNSYGISKTIRTGSYDLYLGSYSGSNDFYAGLLDEARIYNRTLSASEIAAHAACNYTGSGEWAIASGTAAFCRSKIVMNGNLSIFGNLTLDNAELMMNTSNGINNVITVNTSGQLYANYSKINVTNASQRSFLTTHGAASYSTKFRVYNTNFSYFGNGASGVWDGRGLSLASVNDSVFEGCRFENSSWMGMFLSAGGGPGFVLRNNVFNSITYHGIYIYAGMSPSPIVENNTFMNTGYAIGLDSQGLGADETYFFDNTTFSSNGIDVHFTDEQNNYCSRAYFRNSNPTIIVDTSYAGCVNKNWLYSEAHGGNATLTRVWGTFAYEAGFPRERTCGLWHFDEGSGTTSGDETRNGNTSTLANGPTWIDSPYGKALTFNGVNQYAYVPNSTAFDLPNEFTIELRFKTNNLSYIVYPTLINRGPSNAQPHFWVILETGSPALLVYEYSNGSAYVASYWNAPVVMGKWHHLAIAGNRTQATAYLDGVSLGTNAINQLPVVGAGYLYIGAYQGTYSFNGSIDEVRISNKTLQPSEFLPLEHDTFIKVLDNANVSIDPNATATFDNVTMNFTCTAAASCNFKTNSHNITIRNSTIQATEPAKSFNIGTDSYYITKRFVMDNSNLSGYTWTFYMVGDSLNGTSITNSYLRGASYGITLGSVALAQYALRNITLRPTDGTVALDIYWSNANGSTQIIDGINATDSQLYSSGGGNAMITNSRFNRASSVNVAGTNFTCINCTFGLANPLIFWHPNSSLYSKQHNGNATDVRIWGNFTWDRTRLNRNTMGYWRLDEGSGANVADYTNINNGTITGATWTAGRFGKALRFNGSTYVTIPDSQSLRIIDTMTIEAWVKGTGQIAANIYPVAKTSSYALRVAVAGTPNLGLLLSPPAGDLVAFDTGVSVLDGNWHHIAATYSGRSGLVSVYKDGTLVQTWNSGVPSTLYITGDSAYIGTWTSGYGFFNGTVDEVRISNRALTPAEFLPDEHNSTFSLMAGATVNVHTDAIVTFDNMTENGTVTVNGTLMRYKDYQILVVNGSNSPVSGAFINITDNYTGDFLNCTTDSNGYCYPHLFVSLTNASGLTGLKHNMTAAKSGVGSNSILANSSRGNHTIVLGASQGYSLIGNITATGFTVNVTVGGSPLLGPYSGTKQVELRNGSTIIATISHDFGVEDFDLNTITVRKAGYWVGYSGKPATLYVPLRGTFCNVRTCASITNISDTCNAGWVSASSDAQGYYCLVTVSGTVAEEQADGTITKLVAAPLESGLAIVLFCAAFAIVALGSRTKK